MVIEREDGGTTTCLGEVVNEFVKTFSTNWEYVPIESHSKVPICSMARFSHLINSKEFYSYQ